MVETRVQEGISVLGDTQNESTNHDMFFLVLKIWRQVEDDPNVNPEVECFVLV